VEVDRGLDRLLQVQPLLVNQVDWAQAVVVDMVEQAVLLEAKE
jgi:hypothetical protein